MPRCRPGKWVIAQTTYQLVKNQTKITQMGLYSNSRSSFIRSSKVPSKFSIYNVLVPLLLICSLIVSKFDTGECVRCYSCLFHLDHCKNPLDCYNQPDTCSNFNFSPVLSPLAECEFGCEQHVITDATGSMVHWRRGCASERAPRSSYLCYGRAILFLRHEQCWCNTDYCNSATSWNSMASRTGVVLTILTTLAIFVL